MSDTFYRSNVEVREHARLSALAGREIWCNPHIGADAELWFDGYRSVPEEQRGTQPHLRPQPHRVRMTRKRSMAEAGVKALGDRTLKGSTPKSGWQSYKPPSKKELMVSTPKPWAVDGGGW